MGYLNLIDENMSKNVLRIILKNKDILLVGTGHVLRDSVSLVASEIEAFNPDVVAVELDMARFLAKKGKNGPDKRKIHGNPLEVAIMLVLQKLQQKAGKTMGMEPGEDMFSAISEAQKKGIPVALIDQDIRITLKKAKSRLTTREKLRLVKAAAIGFFELSDRKAIEGIMEQREFLISEMRKEFPSLYETLVEDRDKFMADSIYSLPHGRVLAIVGAGHLEGIRESLVACEKGIPE